MTRRGLWTRKYSDICDAENTMDGTSLNQGPEQPLNHLDHEIAQLTKLRSEPHELLSRVVPGRSRLPVSTVKMLVGREGNYSGRGKFSLGDNCHVSSRYLPTNGPRRVDKMKSRVYVSQFSSDGSLLVAACQDELIRIYDVDNGWKVQKNILTKSLRWTVTDTSLSPDQRFLVYSSLSPVVHIVNIGSAGKESIANVTEIHDGLDFAVNDDDDSDLGFFSVKFSMDGQELVAASKDNSIYVYDLEANKLSLRIPAHTSDVNTVCFADETGHLIYSGSDDNLCKVWDRRCFFTKGQPAGILVGHSEGITFIDTRGDGRYFISNGKDQAIKLWDIRKMSSNAKCIPRRRDDWDYRRMEYPAQARYSKHPFDQSLATYRGHSVLCTLIRCYFSPAYSTGQKYIYTGSTDGSVYLYDLVTGALVVTLDYHEAPVRDCSWHPFYPMIITSSWDSKIAQWEYRGEGQEPRHLKRRRRRRVLI